MLLGMTMGWGQWMIGEVTAEQEFQLEQHIRIVQQNVEHHPEALSQVMADLLRQNMVQASIIRSATKRICELEIELELGVKPGDRFQMHPLKRIWRRVVHTINARHSCRTPST